MDFKTKRISKHVRQTKPQKKSEHQFKNLKIHILTIAGGIIFILFLLFIIVQLVKSLDFTNIIFSFGKKLETEKMGKTNILLVGVGGQGHDGADLTDTLIVSSIDYKNKLVPMLSIPRDLYVETKQTGRSRINDVYYLAKKKNGDTTEGMSTLKETVSKITDIPIQYYLKIDFNGFVKIVDSLGGVDLTVEKDIYDPEYPKGETNGYETFRLKAGWQHLDGKTALKYARSRKTTSDFDRAKRQQTLLYAIKEKALSLDILTDPTKIQSLYNSIKESIETNLSLAEIIELAKIAKDFGKESTLPLVINDNPSSCGGFLYTPDRKFFDGASVLLPAGNNYDNIQLFAKTTFENIKTLKEEGQSKIQVLNGTKVLGLAQEAMDLLDRFCLNVTYFGNTENRNLEESTIYYQAGAKGEKPKILDMITPLMPGIKVQAGIPPTYLESEKRKDSVIVIELGKDYLKKRLKNPFDSLKYVVAPSASSTSAAPATTSSTNVKNTQTSGTGTTNPTNTNGKDPSSKTPAAKPT